MDEVVELVVVIPTTQVHLKWSPDTKVTTVFVLIFSPRPEIPPRGQNFWVKIPVTVRFHAGAI
jgi:hypothetical protein